MPLSVPPLHLFETRTDPISKRKIMTDKEKVISGSSAGTHSLPGESENKPKTESSSDANTDFSKRNTQELDPGAIRKAAGEQHSQDRRAVLRDLRDELYPREPSGASDAVSARKKRKKALYVFLAAAGLILVIGAAAAAGYIAGIVGSYRPTVDLSQNVTLNTAKALRYSSSENRYKLDLTGNGAFTIGTDKPSELKITNSAWSSFLDSFRVTAVNAPYLSDLKNGDTITVRISARSDAAISPKDFAIENKFRYTGTDKDIRAKVTGLPEKYSDADAFVKAKKSVISELLAQAEKKAGKHGTVSESRLYFAKPDTDAAKHNDVLCIFVKTTGRSVFDTRWRGYYVTPVTNYLDINKSGRKNHSLKEGPSSILLIKSRLDLLAGDQIEKGTGYEVSGEIAAPGH